MECKCGAKLGEKPNVSRDDWKTPICPICARKEVIKKLVQKCK